MDLTLKLILIVWAVILLGGALYIFTNEKSFKKVKEHNKKKVENQDEV